MLEPDAEKKSVSFHDFSTIYLGIEKYVCMALLSFISSAEAQCAKKRRKVQQIMHICDNELHDYILQTSRAKTDIFLASCSIKKILKYSRFYSYVSPLCTL